MEQENTVKKTCKKEATNEPIESDINVDNYVGRNRCYMPDYYKWMQAKLPYIAFWSNIFLGDQSRHSKKYM